MFEGKAPAMAELAETELQKRSNRLYVNAGGESAAERMAAIVANACNDLTEDRPIIRLADGYAVRKRAEEYMRVCCECGTIPTISGLACALGVTRAAIYHWERDHPDSETAVFMERYRTAMQNALENGIMLNGINTIAGIFLLKAVHGYKESVEITTNSSEHLTELTEDELLARAQALPRAFDDEY